MTLFFEDLKVGDRWTSLSRRVEREDVVDFADLTGDHDPLHEGGGESGESPFGRPVVHGLLGLSVMAGLSSDSPAVKTLALVRIGEWRFERPVYFGDSVHVLTEVAELNAYGRRAGRVIWHRSLVNQHGQTVQSGTLETLVALRSRYAKHAARDKHAAHAEDKSAIEPVIEQAAASRLQSTLQPIAHRKP
ncbi:MaoC family dehydratase [Roseimaritima ulvae]|uniref:Bifunctional protein PaaZ n=1 Tax=Roseimaritima ulvae TaxID=980254 RepID=A0A5B9R002_9BACT|nr:MaoC/PaaZ C-terminal domain-containing protein [Roseimaritima ulvae]QEG43530.1 Bifunctional protein PaaZ [Roseimaritima ulvae]